MNNKKDRNNFFTNICVKISIFKSGFFKTVYPRYKYGEVIKLD